ncbi:hypothetical protein J2X69_003029 [Algoriphagus sp. 4150]|nr:hypothetical protein [Algoriphagus sp. 4150]
MKEITLQDEVTYKKFLLKLIFEDIFVIYEPEDKK